MDPHDRRLSVSKSSSKIFKPSSSSSSSSFAASSSSSRPRDTLVSADLSSFSRVVQRLTGTPPPSAPSSPLRETVPSSSSRSSRLHRFAPPSIRDSLRPSSAPAPLNQPPFHHHHHHLHQLQQEQQKASLPLLHQPQQLHDTSYAATEGPTHQLNDFSWLATAAILSPLVPYTQTADLHQNPGLKPSPYLPSDPPLQSPQLFSALYPPSPTDSVWAITASPRPFSSSGRPSPSLLPFPSEHARDPSSGSRHNRQNEASEWSALSTQSVDDGHGTLHLPSNGTPALLSSSSQGQSLLPLSSSENPAPSPSGTKHSLSGPLQTLSHAQFPPSPASLLPISPPAAAINPWLYPWPPSPLMSLPFSPGLFPPSPGLGSFVSSPGGFSFCGNDYPPKLP